MKIESFPVRFCRIFSIGGKSLLITDHGGELRFFDLSDGQNRFICSESIFDSNYIYGFEQNRHCGEIFCVYGQRFFRIVKILIDENANGLEIRFEKESTVNVGDWIWAMEWIGKEKLALLLGHNQVIVWSTREQTKQINVQCQESCLLYSGIFVSRPSGKDNIEQDAQFCVISGTIFNEIHLWLPLECGKKVVHRLVGHQGVIFGITYDCGMHILSSVSDDRSCRIWRFSISDQFQLSTDQSPTCQEWLRGKFEPLHVLYGHEARVWRSIFIGEKLATAGEDGTICLWDVDSGRLCKKWKTQRSGIRAITMDDSSRWLICGSDSGCIFSVRLPIFDHENEQNSVIDRSFSYGAEDSSMEDVIVVYYCGDTIDQSWISVTNRGNILLCNKDEKNHVLVRDSSLRYSSSHRHGNRIAIGGLEGRVYVLEEMKLSHFRPITGKVFSVNFVGDGGEYLLICASDGLLSLWNSNSINTNTEPIRRFRLPSGKHRWLESALYFKKNDEESIGIWLIVGDRNGGIYFYDIGDGMEKDKMRKDQPREPKQSFPKVHGVKEVTDLIIDHYHKSVLHSIGRDGCWRKWIYDKTNLDNPKWRIVFCEKLTQNFEWLSRFLQRGRDLLIGGFKSNKFVLYNTDTEQYMCEIECGGGHRSYDLRIVQEDNNGHEDTINFLFTKNGKAYEAKQKLDCIVDIVPSMHLRRVTDVITLDYLSDQNGILWIATCSEDTTIAIWSIQEGNYSLRQRLRGHISSVHCMCAKYGWIVSGGGRSELCWWNYVDHSIQYRLVYRQKCKDDDVRCLGVQMCQYGDMDYVMAIYSDGRLSIFSSKLSPAGFLIRPTELTRLQAPCCLTRLKLLNNPHHNRFPFIFSTGTNGKVYIVQEFLLEKSINLSTDFPSACSSEMAISDVDIGLEIEDGDNGDQFDQMDDQLQSVYTRRMKNRARRRTLNRMENTKKQAENALIGVDLETISKTILVEKAGLTALDVRWMENEQDTNVALCCLGSESGAIHLLKFHLSADGNGLEILTIARTPHWHTSSVSGLSIFGNNHLISNGIDQRIGVWKYQESNCEACLAFHSFSHVADPAALCMFWNKNGSPLWIICGAGVQMVNLPSACFNGE